jgi:hypothetical protein
LRGLGVDWVKVRLYGMIISSFSVGGVAGSLLLDVFSYNTLYIPAGLIGGVAGVYTIYAHKKHKATEPQPKGVRS